MTLNQDKNTVIRLKFLLRVVHKECQHLISTDKRLFDTTFTTDRARQLESDIEMRDSNKMNIT